MNNDLRKKRQKRFDNIKQSVEKLEALIEVAALSVVYFILWKFMYRPEVFHDFYGYGKYVLMGVYALLSLVLFWNCEGFKFGHMKITDVFSAQIISTFIINLITYFQLCLMAGKMIKIYPIIILFIADIILEGVLIWIFTYIYHTYNVPKNMLMVYGNRDSVTLKFKMDERTDKYRIAKIVPNELGFDKICSLADEYDAVLINDVPAQLRNDLLKYCYNNGIRAYVTPKLSDIILSGADDITLFDTPLLLVDGGGLKYTERFLKRTMDLLICIIAMIPAAPIMLIVALLIKIEDGGPVFFKQKRITRDEKTFDILKFRSMIVDAEKGGYDLSMRANGRDPRITKVGRFIRATRLDELPQILNIFKGDMSIVGPRPERVENHEAYCEEIPEFVYRTKVKGGLTGYAQIFGKYNTTAYDKLRLDLMYIENYSLLLDIKLILMTLRIMVTPESTEGFEKQEELEKLKEETLKEIAATNEQKNMENNRRYL